MGRRSTALDTILRSNLPRIDEDITDDDRTALDGRPSAEPVVLVADAGGVRTLTLNRPAAFNSFNLELKAALLAALDDAAAEPSVRAVVITGAGRAFCAGQDLKEHLALVAARRPAGRRRPSRSSTTRWSGGDRDGASR